MATMTITNMPEELHQRLEHAAKRDGRSPDQEAIEILDRALRPIPPVSLPEPIIPQGPITADEILAAIREGRE